MRRRLAQILAIGTGVFAILLSLLFATLSRADEVQSVEKGKAIYHAQRCQTCHSIQSNGNRRHPLDGTGSRLSASDIRKWIVSPQEMDAKVKKKGYIKLSNDELDALVAYILSLKS